MTRRTERPDWIRRVEILVEDEREKRYVPLWLFSTVVTMVAMALAFVAAALFTVLAQR